MHIEYVAARLEFFIDLTAPADAPYPAIIDPRVDLRLILVHYNAMITRGRPLTTSSYSKTGRLPSLVQYVTA